MSELINDKANDYATAFSEPTDELLNEIEEFTLNHHAHPNMLSGPLQGKFLEIISKMICPKYILEVGTFTGYSALCLAKGLQQDGFLHTIEIREEDADISQKYFAKSSHAHQIVLHRGNALEIIPNLKETWDLIFIDADKTNYINYYELTLPQLKKGGMILIDNVLFHGDVLKENITGKNGIAINNFNEHIVSDTRVQQVILTIRDGVMMILKK
ncbi:MAG: O-methyltransferase [Ginsengibacter sp.]